MYASGVVTFLLSIIVYFVSKQAYPFLLLTAGIGCGIIIGGIWSEFKHWNIFPQ